MPLLVYTVGSAFGTEKWCRRTGFILAVVVTGVAIASYGEEAEEQAGSWQLLGQHQGLQDIQ
jgi:hypothetical protein